MLWICLEEDVCLYHPNARWEGAFEWLDSSRTTAGELQKIVVSGLETNNQTAPTSPRVVQMGFKKNDPHSFKNKLQHIQLSDTTGTSNETGFYGQIKQKKWFLAANTQDGFGEHRDKKVPLVYNEIYCCIFYVVGLYFCWRSWTSCLDTRHHGFYQIPTNKKSKPDWILLWPMFGSFNRTIIQTQTSKTTQKWVKHKTNLHCKPRFWFNSKRLSTYYLNVSNLLTLLVNSD